MDNVKIEKIAKFAHDVNKLFCEFDNDNSQLDWENLTENQKESTIKGVNFIFTNPETTPEEIHKNWKLQKINDGWVFGEVKDNEKKTHPCIRGYDLLTMHDKFKDNLFLLSVFLKSN